MGSLAVEDLNIEGRILNGLAMEGKALLSGGLDRGIIAAKLYEFNAAIPSRFSEGRGLCMVERE